MKNGDFKMKSHNQSHTKGKLKFHVNTKWKGETKSETSTRSIILGRKKIQRSFTI
jgi:hypothetical protein